MAENAKLNLENSEEIISLLTTASTEEILSGILNLDNDEFELISPILLETFEEEMRDLNNKIAFTEGLKISGVKYEDIVDAYREIEKADFSVFGENFTQEKKDFLLKFIAILVNAAEGLNRKNLIIPVEKVSEDVKLPTYSTEGSAAMDVYSTEEFDLAPGESKIVKTGLKVEVPVGYGLFVLPRSGISAKTKLRVSNAPGCIDSDYRGEIGVILENIEPKIVDLVIDEDGKATGILYGKSYHIEKGERIAQIVIFETPTMAFSEVSKVNETVRGEGGFGSTGTK